MVIVPLTLRIVMPMPDTLSRVPPSIVTFEIVTLEPPSTTNGAWAGRDPKAVPPAGGAVGADVGTGAGVGADVGAAVGAGVGPVVGAGADVAFKTLTWLELTKILPAGSVTRATRTWVPLTSVLVSRKPSGSPLYW